MPMYEYLCPHCGRRFEILQRMGENADGVRCPDCLRAGVEKQLSTFAGRSSGTLDASGFSGGGCGSGGFT